METTKTKKIKVEINAQDPTLLYINGKKYTSSQIKSKKIDNIIHTDKILFKELDEKQYEKDLNLIINTLKEQTTSEELLKEILKDVSPRIIKRLAKRIKDNKPIKKHKGCLGFKIGDTYIQIAGGVDNY